MRKRLHHESLDRLQRCMHRKGHVWLQQFQTLTLPALQGNEAAIWLESLLTSGSIHPNQEQRGTPLENLPLEVFNSPCQTLTSSSDPSEGGEQQSWIEQQATAAVDGAIASMLAEFPELNPSASPLGMHWSLMPTPPAPAVPQVLPARTPPPVFSFTSASAVAPVAISGPQLESMPGEGIDAESKVDLVHLEAFESTGFSSEDDPAPGDGQQAGFAAAPQRSAAEFAANLGSRVLRRLSRTDWRSLARIGPHRDESTQEAQPADLPQWQPPGPEELQEPLALPLLAQDPTARFEDRTSGRGSLAPSSDPLAVVIRLNERQSGRQSQDDAAPAPQALADLRAWLPNASLPRAS